MDEEKPIGVRLNFMPKKHAKLKEHKEELGLTWEGFVEEGSRAIKVLSAMKAKA